MAKTIDQGFSALLDKLRPLQAEHEKAISHRGSVKSCLENNFDSSSFFETGSFGNETGVRHHSDTDYFAVIPTKNLSSGSSILLRKVKEALQYTFPRTYGIGVNTPAVVIPFGTFASENLEVTPCYFTGLRDTPLGKHGAYGIADGNDGWRLSSPSAHNASVKKQDERLGYRLKPLIRLVQAWKYFNNAPIYSFYLELRTTKYAEGKSRIAYDVDVLGVMKYLDKCGLASIQDPMGISGLISPCSTELKKADTLSKLTSGLKRADKANIAKGSNIGDCFNWWDLFYCHQFPSR